MSQSWYVYLWYQPFQDLGYLFKGMCGYYFNSAFFITLQEILGFIGLICSLFYRTLIIHIFTLSYIFSYIFLSNLFYSILLHVILHYSSKPIPHNFIFDVHSPPLLLPTPTSHDDLIFIMVCWFFSNYLVRPLPWGHSSPSDRILCFCRRQSLCFPGNPV